jgi:hypothetical protein
VIDRLRSITPNPTFKKIKNKKIFIFLKNTPTPKKIGGGDKTPPTPTHTPQN